MNCGPRFHHGKCLPNTLTFGVLGLSCETPATSKPMGFHTTAGEPKRAHLRVQKHHENSTRRDLREGRKE